MALGKGGRKTASRKRAPSSSEEEETSPPAQKQEASSSSDEEEVPRPAARPPKFVALSSLSSSSSDSSSSSSSSSDSSSSSSSNSSDASDEEEETVKPSPAPKAAPAAAAKKANAKISQRGDSDIDALLEELEAPSPPKPAAKAAAEKAAAAAKPAAAKAAAGKQKKGKAAAHEKEDIDALLEDIEGTSAPSKPAPAAAAATPTAAAAATAAEKSPTGSEPPATSPAAEGKLSRAAQRRQKKKQQQTKAKETSSEDEAAAKPAAGAAKKAPVNAAVRAAQQRLLLLREQQKKQEEEEERQRKEEEELRRKEEEEERQRAAEKEEKQRRKAERKQRLKEEGKLLSAKDQKRIKKQQQYLQQLQQQGLILPAALSPAPEEGESPPSGSKKIDDRKKKKKEKERRLLQQKQQEEEEAAEKERLLKLKQDLESLAQPSAEPKNAGPPVDDWESLVDDVKETGDSPSSPAPAAAAAAAAGEKKKASCVGDVRKRAAMEQALQEVKEERRAAAMETAAAAAADSAAAEEAVGADKETADGAGAGGRSKQPAKAKPEEASLRSPICCIMGHVDTGKTKLLDKLRRTNVQLGEAGGITQQIGATFFPREALLEQCNKIVPGGGLRLPGLLVIDTPGHASFANLRARGSSLCDLAIVVIDIMHGMEPQTRESLSLLRQKRCPFVVALNKIDRLYGWKPVDWGADVKKLLAAQSQAVRDEFTARWNDAHLQLSQEGFNCALYWENEDVRRYVSVAPTSAHTGEGIADLIHLICSLNETLMKKTITKLPCIFDVGDPSNAKQIAKTGGSGRQRGRLLQCTILEVKGIEGLGTTIDVILVQGILYEGDRIVCCGLQGPIVTTIRALLTPQPLKELRVKGEYVPHPYVQASMGVKIAAPGLEEAVAGTSVFVVEDDAELPELEEEVMKDMSSIFKNVDRSGNGVYVMASTLGALEALLAYLEDCKVPVFAVNLGSVQKKDVRKASVMREKGRPELSVILAFNVKIDAEAEKEAKTLGVRIMAAEIIYHLFDEFTLYFNQLKQEKKKEVQQAAVFPCILSALPQYIFNKRDPIVMGVVVDEGILKIGTPLCVPEKGDLRIGTVASVELNRKPVDKATAGMEVCIKVVGEPNVMVGRHFEPKNKIVSKLTRNSIDCLKEHFRDELSKDDWKTVVQIKKLLDIP